MWSLLEIYMGCAALQESTGVVIYPVFGLFGMDVKRTWEKGQDGYFHEKVQHHRPWFCSFRQGQVIAIMADIGLGVVCKQKFVCVQHGKAEVSLFSSRGEKSSPLTQRMMILRLESSTNFPPGWDMEPEYLPLKAKR
jgi:hypothetical protein